MQGRGNLLSSERGSVREMESILRHMMIEGQVELLANNSSRKEKF